MLNNFIGSHECKADSKGRLIIPSSLKKQMADILLDGFVIKRSFYDTCIELWPRKEYDIMSEKLCKLDQSNRANNSFLNRFLAGVKLIDIDDLGRILIPKDLLIFSKIDKDVVFSSKLGIINIWDKDIFEKSIAFDDEEFANEVEQVLGNLNKDFHGFGLS